MVDEGLSPYAWSNGPHDVYSAHIHGYDKVIYVVNGSITFGLPEFQRKVTLIPGDRLDLPKGTVHDALVGEVVWSVWKVIVRHYSPERGVFI